MPTLSVRFVMGLMAAVAFAGCSDDAPSGAADADERPRDERVNAGYERCLTDAGARRVSEEAKLVLYQRDRKAHRTMNPSVYFVRGGTAETFLPAAGSRNEGKYIIVVFERDGVEDLDPLEAVHRSEPEASVYLRSPAPLRVQRRIGRCFR